jgi:hypothetical protein
MSIEFSSEVEWDGRALFVVAATDGGRVTCRVPQATVHALRIYSDAIGREIYKERHQIISKLAPFLSAKLLLVEGQAIELLPSDVDD